MARMPTFEEIRDEFERGVRTAEQRIERPFRHGGPQTPAAQPVNLAAATAAAPQQEETMSLATIAADIRTAIGNADDWVKQVTETHLPAILAVADRYENDPIVQALEGTLLPPSVAAGIASMINKLAEDYPAQTAPGMPAASQQPVTAAAAQ